MPTAYANRRTREQLRGQPLTAKELECLRWLAAGFSMAEITRAAGLRSEHTAKSRLKQTYAKLGADTAAHAVMLGVIGGWLNPTDGTPTLPPYAPKWYFPENREKENTP